MPTDRESYNIKYGAATQFGKTSGGTGGIMSMLGSLGGGGGDKKEEKKGEPVYNYRTGKTTATPFKLKSGNTTPFKMMGSSPAKIFGGGGLFGGGGVIGNWFQKRKEKREARRKEQMSKALGITATGGGGGGGDGSHTHGTGGEAIGGAQAVTASSAAPEMPVEPADEEVVA